MTRADQITAALLELGDTYAVALSNLRASGCKGQPHSASHCIIAEYLRSRGCDHITVTPISACVRMYNEWEQYEGRVTMPGHLCVLASDFDGNKYPELERDPA